jgi:imidazolonepropionase-like amidohydrolase
MRFLPCEVAEEMMSFVRPVAAESFSFPIVAEGLADILRAGGVGAIGSHGEDYNLGSQHQIWSYATALSPLEALNAASEGGAHFLGLDHELGTIRQGKLADLVLLDGNPLEDIRNTERIDFVMKNGVLYVGDTLDEVRPNRTPYGPVQWDEP